MSIRMNKKYIFIGIILIVALCAGCFALGRISGKDKNGTPEIQIDKDKTVNIHEDKNSTVGMRDRQKEIFVGDVSLKEYVIAYEKEYEHCAKLLQEMILKASGYDLPIEKGLPTENAICLQTSDENGYRMEDGVITIAGPDSQSLETVICEFANMYLGFSFAGDARVHLLNTNDTVFIPENLKFTEAWMEEREPIICLWKTNTTRGVYNDNNVCLKSELLQYTDDQLYEYVKMMKYCGYTGIQVTDMCSTWAQYGGYEYVQERIRFMADAAHSLGMKFTLWVWGAEFNGYGRSDRTVTYFDYQVSKLSKDIPEAVATFDKYYSIYAQLADCSDRVIMHFNDPGKLDYAEDIAFYGNMFREKCLAINPDLDFGISCYTYQIDIVALKEVCGNDMTVYSGIIHMDEEQEPMEKFVGWAANEGFRVGVWSWNLTEMEIDQLAEMNVNAKLIAECYQRTSHVDNVYHPTYWSEMDSYHMINLFSMYCSGQLLQNPMLDPDELLQQVSEDLVGEYAGDLAEILSIIQDARTGNSWQEFRVGYEEYFLESDKYPAELILERCNKAIPKLEKMIKSELPAPKVPMAISVKDLLSMILPHVQQIKEFAEFRLLLDELQDMVQSGEDMDACQAYLDSNYKTVKEYNTVVGVWGGAEARAQYNLINDFCKDNDLITPQDPGFRYLRKQRLLGEMVVTQKTKETCCFFPKTVAFHWQFGFGNAENIIDLVDEMIQEGLLTETQDGEVYLTDWENYKYDF